MITAIFSLLLLIFILLTGLTVFVYIAWQKVSIYLTYNTRYQSAEYELSATTPRKKASVAPSITQKKGRVVQNVDELIDIQDMEFEEGYRAVTEIGRL